MAAKDYYKVSGDSIERANQICPRCGEGVFLAEHKDRRSCGKCAYTEFKK
ncbi:30S ribosomal protein S27ae [Methanolobus sp.]|jgi:small subunit ribosomal protein S27Ae|nr:30S ribosomal protein S27ae [Methanolobus sp.]